MKRSIIFIFYFAIVIVGCNKQVPFNSDKWKSSGGESIMTNQRFNMTDDLIKRKLLINKYKYQVDSLLGAPSRTSYSKTDNELYLVKEVYSTNIDPDDMIFIEVYFDKNQIALNAKLTSEIKLLKK